MPKHARSSDQYDLAIAGGGLAGGLVALALAKKRPELKLLLIEAEEQFGGNHIWSFFESDVEPEHRWLVDPLISRQWDSYDVHFPQYSRRLSNGYCSIESKNLDRELRQQLPAEALQTGQKAKKVENGLVQLADGTEVRAGAVLDVRGSGDISALEIGWQKFCGQMLKLKKPHGLDRPIIMDANVEQIDGYRFLYCLPFGETELFVEDTYYADSATLDRAASHDRIAKYVASKGWAIDRILSEEDGQLPVIYGGDFEAFWNANKGVDARAGARAALIQPITSYSLPMAVKTAMMITDMPEITQDALNKMLRNLATEHWKDGKFYRMLCAMLFKAAKPEKRYLTLQHTYAKPEELIERFYAGKTTLLDKFSMLSGKPPVPISKALSIMMRYR
ncbi:lycopene beta-cyclase CrtY [Parasphingorhabdus sp.]|uniref:lycopene beta-cyclase CrtY n=1 Tax=Parasphingorhabdus sp. TaxID=2709688 RepID=UPI003262E730